MSYAATFQAGPSIRPPELIETIATATTLEMKLSDGSVISYPREPISIGNLTFSYEDAENGRHLYKYCFDNRQVRMIRVGELDHECGRPIIQQPTGSSETATYTINSEYLPGPLPLYLSGPETNPTNFKLPFSSETAGYLIQQIWLQIRFYGNCVDPLVIGPALRPAPPEEEVRNSIHRWVEEYGLHFLRPLDDPKVNLMENEGLLVPTTPFEIQVFDCLKLAIRSMVGDAA